MIRSILMSGFIFQVITMFLMSMGLFLRRPVIDVVALATLTLSNILLVIGVSVHPSDVTEERRWTLPEWFTPSRREVPAPLTRPPAPPAPPRYGTRASAVR
ncbi:TPA_asm: ORFX protein [Populus alba waikavirus]|uniref:ORFX protein n=1 Tax=Populus alba waikavirus TaxID=3027347 RepID=A0AA48SFM4_9SECO|nr:TPA_asm: ORFX protein [Populus alba waikavirus]